MPRTLSLRDVPAEECAAVERLAHSRTAASRLVERARVVLAALDDERVSAIAERFHITAATVYLWLHRFNDGGLGVRLPTQVRRLSESDRTLVEDPALAGAERTTL